MRSSLLRLSVLILTTLCGCQTSAQREYQTMKAGNETAAAEMRACVSTVYSSPEYTPLRAHLPYNVADATLQQLADASMITPREWEAILAIHPKVQQCRNTLLAALAKSTPSIVPILTQVYNRSEDDLLALSAHKLTWGQYVVRARDRSAEAQAALQAEGQRVVDRLQRENAIEIEQRQRAAEALAAWAQTQELINAANRPVITNCSGLA